MNHVLSLLGWNVVLSVPFALLAWCLCRIRPVRVRPALCHAIWLLVILKLVTPPLIPVPVLPAATPLAEVSPESQGSIIGELPPVVRANPADATLTADSATAHDHLITESPERLSSAPVASTFSWREVTLSVLALSVLITLGIWFAAIRQLLRVRRLLRTGLSNTDHAFRLLDEVRRQFGLSSPPKLYVVEASISPMLWAERGGPAVILPQQLANELDDDQLRHVFAHELAHYARRDHWTNVFGFLVTTLFWWHPVAWLARHELNLAAELCCDALALSQLSGSRKSYARTLLAVIDSVDCSRLRRPILAVTFGGQSALRRRFQMLAEFDVRSNFPWVGWCLLLMGALALVLLPIRVQGNLLRTELPKPATMSLGSEEERKPEVADVSEQSNSTAITGTDSIEGSSVPVPDARVTGEEKPSDAARNDQIEAKSIANLQEIALAMHTHHGSNGSFPPAASYSKDGQPLLSWRVHLLPHLGQNRLYQQFRLDEPWDSEHNRKLIARMPQIYVDPAQDMSAKEGKTTYVVPVGEKTIFATKAGTNMSTITDGTVNTVMIVDVSAESAVIWTKPDDWNFLIGQPGKGLVDSKRERFRAAYADATVHTLPIPIDLDDLRRLMQIDDREVLGKRY